MKFLLSTLLFSISGLNISGFRPNFRSTVTEVCRKYIAKGGCIDRDNKELNENCEKNCKEWRDTNGTCECHDEKKCGPGKKDPLDNDDDPEIDLRIPTIHEYGPCDNRGLDDCESAALQEIACGWKLYKCKTNKHCKDDEFCRYTESGIGEFGECRPKK